MEIDEVAITSRSFSGTGRISTSLNPMRISDAFNDVALPTIGSRAAGKYTPFCNCYFKPVVWHFEFSDLNIQWVSLL